MREQAPQPGSILLGLQSGDWPRHKLRQKEVVASQVQVVTWSVPEGKLGEERQERARKKTKPIAPA